MCVWGVDFVFVSTIVLLDFRTVFTFFFSFSLYCSLYMHACTISSVSVAEYTCNMSSVCSVYKNVYKCVLCRGFVNMNTCFAQHQCLTFVQVTKDGIGNYIFVPSSLVSLKMSCDVLVCYLIFK